MLRRFSLFLVLACAFPLLLSAQSEEENTIMGYKLGAHWDSIPKQNLLKMGRFQKLYRYDRQDEGLTLNGMKLVYVQLFIWENHLHSIEIKTEGAEGDNFKASLKALYGEGKQLDAMGFRYQWFTPTTRVLWDQNLATKEGVATYVDEKTNDSYYKFMYQLQNRER
jgi:hypothetical protein